MHEDGRVVVAAALEFKLQHGLDKTILRREDGAEVGFGFERGEPDVQADGEGQKGAGDDAVGVGGEEETEAWAFEEDGGDGD